MKFKKWLIPMIVCSFITSLFLLANFSKYSLYGCETTQSIHSEPTAHPSIPSTCSPKTYLLNGTKDTRVSEYYEVPIIVWDVSFYHNNDNQLNILFLGPSATRGWVSRGNWGQPVSDDISEASYVFYCSFPDTGTTTNAHIILDPHHNQFLISCPVPPEEIDKNYNNKEKKKVEVRLHDVTHSGVSDVIPVCRITQEKFKVTACTMIKNEAPRVAEWLVGVDHVFLYDHASTDDLLGILRPYIASNKVTVVPWNFDHNKYNAQTVQLNSCIYRFRDFSEWQLHVDVDEFPYPPSSDSIVPYLEGFFKDHTDMASLSMNQYQFGVNMTMLNEGYFQIESGQHRAANTRNGAHKPALYVKNVRTVSVHMVTSGGPTHNADVNQLLMHHFWRDNRGNNPEFRSTYDPRMHERFSTKIKNNMLKRYMDFVQHSYTN